MNFQLGWVTLTVVNLFTAAPAWAQNPPAWMGGSAGTVLPPELKEVGLVEHNGDSLPLELPFVDEAGQGVQLNKYFNGSKPVVLQLGYFGCPMLCNLVSKGMVTSLKQIGLVPGKDFEFVYVSIDPTEKPQLAKEKQASFVQEFGQKDAGAGLHLLTGRPEAIDRLTKVAGFGYKWVPSAGQYAHPAAILIVSPQGKISRYLYGVQFDKQTLRLSLVEASQGKIGTPIDQFLLTCFQYDGTQGKYAMTALAIMRGGGVLSILVVGTALFLLFRRERRIEAQRKLEDEGLQPQT